MHFRNVCDPLTLHSMISYLTPILTGLQKFKMSLQEELRNFQNFSSTYVNILLFLPLKFFYVEQKHTVNYTFPDLTIFKVLVLWQTSFMRSF